MVLTNTELVSALTHEVHVLRHLVTKIDADAVGFRATPKQRSNIELVRYLVVQGPQLTSAIKSGTFDRDAWGAAQAEVDQADLAGLDAMLATQPAWYAEQFGSMTDDDFRGSVQLFGSPMTRGALIVTMLLANYAAYRTQLFGNLKLCGRDELNTSNLWRGVDPAPKA